MAERPKLIRRTSTHDKLLDVMKGGNSLASSSSFSSPSSSLSPTQPASFLLSSSSSLLSPPLSPSVLAGSASSPTISSPSSVSPQEMKRSPSNNPRRVLKREVAMRQLPIRLIAQKGAPSAKQILRATVSVFEWASSIGLAADKEEKEKVKEKKEKDKEKKKKKLEKAAEEEEKEKLEKAAEEEEKEKSKIVEEQQKPVEKEEQKVGVMEEKLVEKEEEQKPVEKEEQKLVEKEQQPVEKEEQKPVEKEDQKPVEKEEQRPVEKEEQRPVEKEQKPVEKEEQKPVEREEQMPVEKEEQQVVEKVEQPQHEEKELLEEDESLKLFLDAWNQLDAHEENLSVQSEIKHATVEIAALEALKEQNLHVDSLRSTPTTITITLSFPSSTTPEISTSQSTASSSVDSSSASPTSLPAETTPAVATADVATTAATTATSTTTSTTVTTDTPSSSSPATTPSPSLQATEAVASAGVMKPDVLVEDVATPTVTVPVSETNGSVEVTLPHTEKTVEQAQEAPAPLPPSVPDEAAADLSYTGPHYESPITQNFVEALIQYFATSGLNAKLPYAYAQAIFQEVHKILQAEPIILDISIPAKGSVVVCGDTHGQFPDLITILRDTGFPSPTKTIIFNGDFVDRGPAGVELLLTLYSLKLLFPKYIYLHRGNHEQDYVNKTYNFEKQVLQKYDEAMYTLIHDTFAHLPLGCVIADKVLVIHGGLPEDTELTVADFRALPKLRDIPVGKGKTAAEKAIEDILWGDPKDRRGIRASKRGAGVEFGPDITANFIRRNNLELIVRSHELMAEGFALTHDNQVMTIFSASYYCSSNTNKGAFLIFEDGADVKVPSVVQFYSQAFSAKDNVLKSCVKETLEKLRERIHASRHALMAEFAQRDSECSGSVTELHWSAAMAKGLGIQIEWSGMLPYLAKVEDNGNVLYARFLARHKPKPPPRSSNDDDEDEEDEAVKKEEKIRKMKHKRQLRDVCTKLLTRGEDIDAVFTALDENKDEKIDYLEFYNALSSFDLGLTDDQIYDMMFLMDDDHVGVVHRKHFINYFKNQFERVALIARDTWLPDAVVAAGNALSKEFDYLSSHKMRIKSGFRKVPTDDDGYVTHELFAKWIVRTLHMDTYSQADRMKIAMYVDFNNNGKISWREFKRAFMALDGTDSLPEDVLLHMCEVVAKNKAQDVVS